MSELAQRSTTARLGPGGPPSLRKHCQTGLSDVGAKKSQGRKSSPGQCYDSWSLDGGVKPPREASRGSPWLPLDGERPLQAACSAKANPMAPGWHFHA